jgi:hypothetical protein
MKNIQFGTIIVIRKDVILKIKIGYGTKKQNW